MKLFDPGRCVATPAAIDLLAQHYILPADILDRHIAGDWGDVSMDDQEANREAVRTGERIVSAYHLNSQEIFKILVITEAQGDEGVREYTTIMLPGEYQNNGQDASG